MAEDYNRNVKARDALVKESFDNTRTRSVDVMYNHDIPELRNKPIPSNPGRQYNNQQTVGRQQTTVYPS